MSEQWDSGAESGATSLDAAAGKDRMPIDAVEIVGEREGLPQNYRMRADRHYVDQLAAPAAAQPVRMVPIAQIECPPLGAQVDLRPLIESVRAHGIVHPLIVRRQHGKYGVVAGRKRLMAAQNLRLATVPCLVHELNDSEAAAVRAADDLAIGHERDQERPSPGLGAAHGLIAAHLSKIRGCADMSADGIAGLNRPAFELLRAHAWRASQLAAALNLITNAPFPPHRERSLAAIVDDVIGGFAAETSLSGVALRAEIPGGLSASGLDEGQLSAGLAGALLATLPLVGNAVRPTVIVRASTTDAAGVSLDVIQQDAAVSLRLAAGFFDDDPSTDRAGGYAAALGAIAAKAAAEKHGGRATFEALDHGSRLTIVVTRRS